MRALRPLAGARAGGLVPLRFDHFGNWREELAGRDWAAYLASRPGALRETIRRRLRAAERDPVLSFACHATPTEVEAGIAQAFDPNNKDWAREYAELKELLTPEEWATANESTQYARYNILVQSGTAMLAQANSLPQSALRLLQ